MNLLVFNLATDADDPILWFSVAWLEELARHCWRISIVTMRRGRVQLPENVRVYSVGKERSYSEARRLVEFYRVLLALLRGERFDACFAHMQPLFAVLGAPLLKVYRVPVVLWYAHGHVPFVLRVAEKVVDRIVTSSPQGCRLVSEKVIVVGQGIDTKRFGPAKTREAKDPFTILSVGRISPVKRNEDLIEAIGILRQSRPEMAVRVVIVGDAPDRGGQGYREQLLRRVEDLGLGSQIEFAAAVPGSSIVQYYQTADVLVNLSETGSLDKVVLEAMSCCVPVLSANGAYVEMLSSIEPHLVVPQRQPEVLAERLAWVAGLSVQERRELSVQLREIVVRDHSQERFVGRLMEILRGARRV